MQFCDKFLLWKSGKLTQFSSTSYQLLYIRHLKMRHATVDLFNDVVGLKLPHYLNQFFFREKQESTLLTPFAVNR